MDVEALLTEAIAGQNNLAAALKEYVALVREEKTEQYVKVEELVEQLGSAFTVRKIEDDMRAGYFQLGKDYINTSNGTAPRYAYCVKRIRRVYQTEPHKRKIYA